jgi:hypothetical protein
MKKLTTTLLLLILFILSCKEEFSIDSIQFDNSLVVEGFITNNPGPYRIKLSTSAQVDNPAIYPKTNCTVTIFDDQGYSEKLSEIEPGLYTTSKTGIQGKIGESYKLSIITPNEEEYETEFQEMLAPTGIDSAYEEIEYQESEEAPYGVPGYQFFINTKQAEEQSKYFLWTMVETYEYNADFKPYQILNNASDLAPNFDTLYTCWLTDNVKKVFTGETGSLTSSEIKGKRLHFVSANSRRLSIRYSLLINQYTIDEKSYSFWKDIEDQMTSDNVLFISQSYNIKGNIKNVSKPEENVLGHFTVASLSQKRIFVNRPYLPINYNKCYVILNEDFWETNKDEYGIIYMVMKDDGWVGSVKKECLDCRMHGGELNKPDFWID